MTISSNRFKIYKKFLGGPLGTQESRDGRINDATAVQKTFHLGRTVADSNAFNLCIVGQSILNGGIPGTKGAGFEKTDTPDNGLSRETASVPNTP